MWVVKLGGSLASTHRLLDWLAVLATPRETRVVIVPGGGAFADQVRQAQRAWRFDDSAAHRMAILAMRQYGLMLSALQPRLAATDSMEIVPSASGTGPATLWLPDPDRLDAAGVRPSWDMTSDSIAAWLAKRISATRLGLVKCATVDAEQIQAQDLAAKEIVDRGFPGMLRAAPFQTWLFAAEGPAYFAPEGEITPCAGFRVSVNA